MKTEYGRTASLFRVFAPAEAAPAENIYFFVFQSLLRKSHSFFEAPISWPATMKNSTDIVPEESRETKSFANKCGSVRYHRERTEFFVCVPRASVRVPL